MKIDKNGQPMFRYACDACTFKNNGCQHDRKQLKRIDRPRLPDSAFMPDAPMPAYCFPCSYENSFTKASDGWWNRSCDKCIENNRLQRHQMRANFLENGNKETHDYCNTCGTIKEIAAFTRCNVFQKPEKFDDCNDCSERVDPLKVLWDARAYKVIRKIEKFSDKIHDFEAHGCCGPAAAAAGEGFGDNNNNEPCIMSPILETLVMDENRPLNERSILLHYDHILRWLKSAELSSLLNPIDPALEQLNAKLRCAACHMIKSLNCGDLGRGGRGSRLPDEALSETAWKKINEKLKAFDDAGGCCGDNRGNSGSCRFQEHWKKLRQKLSSREFTILFQWDHDLDNFIKVALVSNISNDLLRAKEQEKCHLRCIFCHAIKGLRCGDFV